MASQPHLFHCLGLHPYQITLHPIYNIMLSSAKLTVSSLLGPYAAAVFLFQDPLLHCLLPLHSQNVKQRHCTDLHISLS
jgi:hypothetical protein